MATADINLDGGNSPESFIQSVLCIIAAGLFHNLAQLSVDQLWVWAFRVLSAMSIIIVIFINAPKIPEAWQGWRKMFKRNKSEKSE